MPVPAEFGWSETVDSVAFTIKLPSSSTKSSSSLGQRCLYSASHAVDFIISPFYIKLSAPPYFFEADLFDEIDTEASSFRLTSAIAEGHFQLKKKRAALWRHFSATHNPELNAEEIRSRRSESLNIYENKQEERRKKQKSIRYQRQRTSQEEQWRIDRGRRDWLENKKEEEKRRAVQSIFSESEERSTTATAKGEYGKETDVHNSTTAEDCSPCSQCNAEESVSTREIEEADDCSGLSERSPEENSGSGKPVLEDKSCCPPEKDTEEQYNSGEEEALPQNSTSTVNEGSATSCDILLNTRLEERDRTFPTNDDLNRTPRLAPDSEDVRCSCPTAPPGPTTEKEALSATAASPRCSESGVGDREAFITGGSKKVTLNFTARKHYRLPARGDKIPPFPRNITQTSNTRDKKNAATKLPHEKDQQWLKDKGFRLLKNGDLCGAVEAYTEALKIVAEDVDCLTNRSYAYLMLGDLDKCIEDCQHAVGVLTETGKTPEGYPAPPLSPHNSRVRLILYNRLAVCCTWKGCFDQAELYFSKATEDAEEGQNIEDMKRIREDGLRLKGLQQVLETKLKADFLLRGNLEGEPPAIGGKSDAVLVSHGKGGDPKSEKEVDESAEAKRLYTVMIEWAKPIKQYTLLAALSLSNRALVSLRRSEFEESLRDSKEALQCLQNSDFVLEKSLCSTLEACCWRKASVFSAGDPQREFISSGVDIPSGASQRQRVIVTKANERAFKNLLVKARLRKSSALEQLGHFHEALQDALEALRMDPFTRVAKEIARRASKKMEEGNLPRCTSKELISSTEHSTVLLSGNRDGCACHTQAVAKSRASGQSGTQALRLEVESIDELLQAASAHLKKQEVNDALDLYRFASNASRRALLARSEGEEREALSGEEGANAQAEHKNGDADSEEGEAERKAETFSLPCAETKEEGWRTRAGDKRTDDAKKKDREEEERLERWLRFHRCRALANATFCLHRLNESQKLVDVATEALDEVSVLKSSLEAVDQDKEEPNYNELLKIECACLSRRGLAFRDLNRVTESSSDHRSVQALLSKVEQCCV